MWEAIYLLKRQPTEIEADLSHYHNLDIRDWHRGTLNEWGGLVLSSRMLLVRVHKLPATSETKRDGNWSYLEEMVKTMSNEISQMRVDVRALGNMPSGDPPMWHSPSDIRALIEAQEDAENLRSDVLNDLAWGVL